MPKWIEKACTFVALSVAAGVIQILVAHFTEWLSLSTGWSLMAEVWGYLANVPTTLWVAIVVHSLMFCGTLWGLYWLKARIEQRLWPKPPTIHPFEVANAAVLTERLLKNSLDQSDEWAAKRLREIAPLLDRLEKNGLPLRATGKTARDRLKTVHDQMEIICSWVEEGNLEGARKALQKERTTRSS